MRRTGTRHRPTRGAGHRLFAPTAGSAGGPRAVAVDHPPRSVASREGFQGALLSSCGKEHLIPTDVLSHCLGTCAAFETERLRSLDRHRSARGRVPDNLGFCNNVARYEQGNSRKEEYEWALIA